MKKKEFVSVCGYGEVELLDEIPEIGEEFGNDVVIDIQEKKNGPEQKHPESAPLFGYALFALKLKNKELDIISEKTIAVDRASFLTYKDGKNDLEEMYEWDLKFGIKHTKDSFKKSFLDFYKKYTRNPSDEFRNGYKDTYKKIYNTLPEK